MKIVRLLAEDAYYALPGNGHGRWVGGWGAGVWGVWWEWVI